jgi:integrase
MSRTIEEELRKVNQQLKAGVVGVSIRLNGKRLHLVATLPPKPTSPKQYPHQQQIALGIYANFAGIAQAKKEALSLGGLIASKEFRWEDYKPEFAEKIAAPKMTGDWLDEFEKDYWLRRGRSPKTQTTWSDYQKIFKLLEPGNSLSKEAIMEAIALTEANTRTREKACNYLGALAKFAGIKVDLKPYKGNYQQRTGELIRDIPSDEYIEAIAQWIEPEQWRVAFRLLATYGLRNHELFYLDFSEMGQYPGVLIVQGGGKTGFRKVWPCKAEWWKQWGLADITQDDLPRCSGKSNSDLGQRVTRAFERGEVGFPPYNLRHAWAIRTAILGLDPSIAAKMMGHSLEVHYKKYHRWLSESHLQLAWEKMID